MNTLRADVVVAGVNQRHGLWESGQLPEVIFSNDQLLQLRQTHKGSIIDGRDLVGSQVDPLQFVWNETPLRHWCLCSPSNNDHAFFSLAGNVLMLAKSDLLIFVILL